MFQVFIDRITHIGGIGHFAVVLAFVMAIFSAVFYFKATRDADEVKSNKRLARLFFGIHAVGVFGIVAILFAMIHSHRYEYHYVWSHSSDNLPVYYMISSFWEGQEGSFLLWTFWHVVVAMVVILTAKKWESHVMTIFMGVQAFLVSMILGVVFFETIKIGSSPFLFLRDVIDAPIFKANPSFVPDDGNGLNPLLQNYWMVIHPPTLFLGFAATLVPFCFAIAGLWRKQFTEWVDLSFPWVSFTAGILGLGIMMGAYWAYETLNFGGYWNWDPVENAVYVPWLILVAGMHLMIIAKRKTVSLSSFRNYHCSVHFHFICNVFNPKRNIRKCFGAFFHRFRIIGSIDYLSFRILYSFDSHFSGSLERNSDCGKRSKTQPTRFLDVYWYCRYLISCLSGVNTNVYACV